MQKSEIINALGEKYGFTSHLEISTPTTGAQYSRVDRTIFRRCERLVYALSSQSFDDDEKTYETAARSSSAVVKRLLEDPGCARYDLVFVDPYHSYENSLEDLAGAFDLVRPGGIVVVHDCNPTNADIVSPHFTKGEWCGLTYWAYIDFVLGKPGITYYTVDTDYGCGVIFKRPGLTDNVSSMQSAWASASTSDVARYAFFDQNRQGLLNLIGVDAFQRREMPGLSKRARDAALAARLDAIDAHAAATAQSVSSLTSDLAHTNEILAAMASRMSELIAMIGQTEGERSQLADALAQSLATQESIQRDLAVVDQRFAEVAGKNRLLEARIEALLRSTSWRAAAPARALVGLLRKLTRRTAGSGPRS